MNDNLFSLHTKKELFDWINYRNNTLYVECHKISLDNCQPWFYDDDVGEIRNKNRTFFQIIGVRQCFDEKKNEQPIIIQNEIGFLGILCCKINGVWHFLMQAKIEPGNVNTVQLSPTIQATKSNFTKQHGGQAPAFLEYFINMNSKNVLVDQIQSEQSSRFLSKRNRNVILISDKCLEETDSHKWMTFSQIKEFMHYDNLVNMDTRTVLSCIPYVLLDEDTIDISFGRNELFRKTAMSLDRQTIIDLYTKINNIKMFRKNSLQKIPLYSLQDWIMDDNGEFRHIREFPFNVIFCKISIEGREVTNWNQPLFAANGVAVFGLFCCIDDSGKYKFLVKLKPEIGCFDTVEIGPTVQEECITFEKRDIITSLFFEKLMKKENVIADVMLSEEGGRFYHEQNRNVIIEINKSEIDDLGNDYVWSDYGTLNILTQVNNCLNIQLRNLLSILEI